MAGIYLLFVSAIWLLIVIWLAKLIAKIVPWNWWGKSICTLAFLCILPLPLIDEIVGGRQFEKLCKENSNFQFDRAKATGRTVYLIDPPETQIENTWVSIRMQSWKYVDAITGEPVVSFNLLNAKGGRLIRMLGILEGNAPLIFKNYCEPDGQFDRSTLLKDLQITTIRRPAKNNGEKNDNN